jgi:hypothetical protein
MMSDRITPEQLELLRDMAADEAYYLGDESAAERAAIAAAVAEIERLTTEVETWVFRATNALSAMEKMAKKNDQLRAWIKRTAECPELRKKSAGYHARRLALEAAHVLEAAEGAKP